MALAARIASPQGVAFHTSTDAAPAERGARRPFHIYFSQHSIYFHHGWIAIFAPHTTVLTPEYLF